MTYLMLQAIQQAQLAKSQAVPAAPADPAEAAAGARVCAYLDDVTTLHYCRAGDFVRHAYVHNQLARVIGACLNIFLPLWSTCLCAVGDLSSNRFLMQLLLSGLDFLWLCNLLQAAFV